MGSGGGGGGRRGQSYDEAIARVLMLDQHGHKGEYGIKSVGPGRYSVRRMGQRGVFRPAELG